MENVTATISQFARILAANMQADIATLVFAQPGIGKTEIVQTVGNSPQFADRFGGRIFVLSTTEYNPIDLGGLYWVEEGRTVRCPVASIPLDQPVLILIDEFGDCPAYEQSGWYRLLLNNTLGEHKLASGSYVCAATNRPEDSAASREVSTAAKGRCCCVTLRADARSVLDYAIRKGWHDTVRGFIGAYPAFIDDGFSPDDQYAGSTPRDFARLNSLESKGLISKNYDIAVLQVAGNIGQEAGYKYCAFRQLQIPSPDHVFKSPLLAPVLESKEMQFAYCAAIVGAMTVNDFASVTSYAMRLDRVSGFALCYDIKSKFPAYKNSPSAVQVSVKFQDLFSV